MAPVYGASAEVRRVLGWALAMEPPAPRKEPDRRNETPRRNRTRNGWRESDPDDRTECPWCTSRNIDVVATLYGVDVRRCDECHQSWVSARAECP